jgi:arabinose-5-phosphate isomerase
MAKTCEEIIQGEINAIMAIPIDGINEAVDMIVKCNGKVILTGMGKAGLIAKKIAATFSSTGTPAFFMHPSEAQHGDLGMISDGDLIIAFSNSGKTREVIETVILANQLISDLKVIAVSSNRDNELASISNIVIETGGYPEICTLGMAPTSSTTAMLVIGDVLSVMTMERKSITMADYCARHHGGYLGQKARQEIENKKLMQ